jgi:hypothetical protein
MDLLLQFDDNGTSHDDLTLRFAGQPHVCDSYYLALDHFPTGAVEAGKVKVVLRRLLEQWLMAVMGVQDGGTVYLPYDFSDQHTGWLRCERSADVVTVSLGWAEVEGYSFFPSDVGEYLAHLPGFRPSGPSAQAKVMQLIQAIRNSINLTA